jgi:hypothetical protein
MQLWVVDSSEEMTITNSNLNSQPQRVICGVPTEIYSIMFADLYDPTAIPSAWQKFWVEFPKTDIPSNGQAFGVSIPIEDSNGKLHYVAGVEVNDGYEAPVAGHTWNSMTQC